MCPYSEGVTPAKQVFKVSDDIFLILYTDIDIIEGDFRRMEEGGGHRAMVQDDRKGCAVFFQNVRGLLPYSRHEKHAAVLYYLYMSVFSLCLCWEEGDQRDSLS